MSGVSSAINEQCERRVFTERLAETAPWDRRRTAWLSAALNLITLALGGAAGSRLAAKLGILASDSTLLRQLWRKVIEKFDSPHVLGIDDWAWKRGHRYGTILCDMERGGHRSTAGPQRGEHWTVARRASGR